MEQVSGSTTRQSQITAWALARSIVFMLMAMTVPALAGLSAVQAQAVTIRAVEVAKSKGGPLTTTAVTGFKYLVNVDNTGTTTQRGAIPGSGCHYLDRNIGPQHLNYPDSCAWTSIAGAASSSPIFTQGSTVNGTVSLPICAATTVANCIPAGRYLVSVLADGYRLDGKHFTVGATDVAVTVGLYAATDADPLPDAQIQAAVFEDISPVNSAPDLPAEHGLAGFQGHITDYLGEVTTNVYGDPLCTRYDSTGAAIPGSGGRCLSKCYVVNGGVDVGTVSPIGWANPNTPNASGFGRCPTPVISDVTGTITPPIPMWDVDGLARATDAQGRLLNVPDAAAIEGKVKIPNLGPNRYALSVTPSDGSGWVQTTTLEGNHDWDAWVMEGATGLDTEFTIAGEPFPAIIFGYIPVPGTPSAIGSPVSTPMLGTGTIKGVVEAVKIYVPTTGGVGGLPGEIWGGLQGAKIDKPISYPWVTLTDLGNGDTVRWAGRGDVDGKFSINNVPAGTYTLTWWDEPQNTILDLVNVTIASGESIDMGVLPLTGWWTVYDGYVFDDQNRNGVMDPGEQGLPGYTITMRKRENSLMDRGTTVATTDANGYYKFEAAYPMTQFLVMEAYDDTHYTTGITYQADNQPTPTTVIGAGVDVSVHPIIGLSGRMDWGKHVYDATGANGVDPRNGGIVGTVSYDTTRNELDPRYAAVEDWQPSIPNLLVKLYWPVKCGTTTSTRCDATGRFELDLDGAYTKGALLNTYLTETWERPTGCVARGVDGNPLASGTDEQVLSPDGGCIEAPLMGVQFSPYATGQGTPDANFGASVDGNYGFGDGCFVDASNPRNVVPGVFNEVTGECATGALQALPAGNYLVQVEIPKDAFNQPLYKVTREEDINIGNGDVFAPAVAPSECAGPLHTVDVAGLGTDGYGDITLPNGIVVPASTPTLNQTFVDIGGSPYEGQQKPLCDTKLVALQNGKSIAPAFNLFTDVPIPGRLWFISIDDLNFSSNPQSTTFGEKAGMPFIPVGVYDWADRLVTTIETDYNGMADVLLPSTNRINCPTPSGVCGNLYRFVGNDPGVPGRLNPNYNPTYRTIAAEFESLPGLIVPSDVAPTQVGVTVQLPGAQTTSPVMCMVNDPAQPADTITPELYAVSRPYVSVGGNAAARTITITGKGFGPSGQVTLGGNVLPTGNVTWSDTQLTVVAPTNTSVGPKQLNITNGLSQKTTINGVTIHALGTGYNPQLYEVGPTGSPFAASTPNSRRFTPAETLPAVADHAIQKALDAAASFVANGNNRDALVVVHPNNPSYDNPRQNPRGAYYENLIISSKVKLQGVGPGAPDGSVKGSIIDGGAFAGDSPVATDWYNGTPDTAGITGRTWAGNQTIYDGAVISLYLPDRGRNAFPTSSNVNTAPSIDGFDLRGGNQQGFPGNINPIGGGATGQPAGLITQGGAIFANAYARNLRITNNVVQNNGGAYGTIRIGTPDLTGDFSSHNEGVWIGGNRIITNAGTNQAGGIGLFAGSDNYVVTANDICGNFSSEYGGGISAVGYSPGGKIDHNRIYFNRSFDEGGGIMIAGALPANTTTVSRGSGPVDIYNNLIQANLANDDGGGLRFLMAGNFPMNVYNNIIVNNISTHEGGGIGINDAPNVRVFNNTIMKNLTTATAITSNGSPAPAGLSTSKNSDLLQATLPAGSPLFSNPLLFNNIFWDNRAGKRELTGVTGLTGTINNWDLGVADMDVTVNQLSPTNSLLQVSTGTAASPTNLVGTDPSVTTPYDVSVTFNTWRNNPAFLGAILISADLPPNLMGDFHLSASSPAINFGAVSKVRPAYQGGGTQAAPSNDIDGQSRPQGGGFDAGADERVAAPAPIASVTTTLAFGNRLTGSNTDLNLTLSNTGNATLNGISVGAFPAGFSRNGGSCGASLNAGSTCTITVRFSPTAVAAYSGTVSITAGNATVNGSPVSLSGAGIAAPGTVAFTGENGPGGIVLGVLAFGDQTGNVSNTVTLTVGGGTPVTFGAAAVTNSLGTAFAKGAADTCSNTTVSPGGTCTITVDFNAPAGQFNLRIGTLTVPHNGNGNPAVLPLTGR